MVSDKHDFEIDTDKYVILEENFNDRLIVNSLGEGAMWVSNLNGNFENGDYITSSEIKGIGTRQLATILHNFTVAKITQDCDFTDNTIEIEHSGSFYKKQFVGVTYHCG